MMQQMQQQQQQQQQQQRAPQQGLNANQQMQQLIFNTLNQQTASMTGWQSGMMLNERMGLIYNL